MGQKTALFQLVWFLTLTAFSILFLYPAGQHTILLLFPLIPIQFILLSGRSPFIRRVYYPVCLITVVLITFTILKVKVLSTFSAGVPTEIINGLSGYVIHDSSLTKGNNTFMTIFVSQASTVYGQSVSARGLVNVVCNERLIISSGIEIRIGGKFSETLFSCSRLNVTGRNTLGNLRELFITELEKRVLGKNPTQANLLSILLLTGRSEDSNLRIKALAENCGCTHILALSGMHLNTLTLVFKPVKNRKLNYILCVIVSLFFVFIAGPRPSLVRALLMLIFRFLPLTERLVVCFITQLLLFPFSMMNVGCIYSYLAIFAISYLSPLVKSRISIVRIFATSAAVVFLIAPVDMLTFGSWHPIAILAGPPAGILIASSMFTAVLLALFGNVSLISKAVELSYTLLEKLLVFFSCSSDGTWKDYAVFASLFTLLILSVPAERQIRRQRFKKISKTNIMRL